MSDERMHRAYAWAREVCDDRRSPATLMLLANRVMYAVKEAEWDPLVAMDNIRAELADWRNFHRRHKKDLRSQEGLIEAIESLDRILATEA